MKKLLILAIGLAPFLGYSQERNPSDSILKNERNSGSFIEISKEKTIF